MADKQLQWIAATTRCNHEVSLRDNFRENGHEYFIPTRFVLQRFGSVVREVEKAVIPNLIFLRVGWGEAFRIQQRWPNKMTYIRSKDKRILVIPEPEMDRFICVMTEMQDRAKLLADVFVTGDRVAVREGPLAGVEGVLADCGGKREFVVRIGTLCAVSVRIPRSNLIRLPKQ